MNWHIHNWLRTWKYISKRLCGYEIMTLLYFSKPFKNDFIYKFVKKKHEFVCNYLSPILEPALESYKDNKNLVSEKTSDKNIWILWWQGIENAPDLVKMCFDSVKRYAGEAKVVLLSEDNIERYLEIPDFIKEHFHKRDMSMPFFSDYIRTCLLEKYGGLWLDATVYVSKDIPDKVFNAKFFTLHTKEMKTPFISNNRIHCYVLGGQKGSPLFTYMRDSAESYWQKNMVQIDYYLIDYIIMYGYWHNDKIRATIDDLEYTSESLYELVKILNRPYSEKKVKRLLEENIFLKLNWRKNCRQINCGKHTNFYYLKNNKL